MKFTFFANTQKNLEDKFKIVYSSPDEDGTIGIKGPRNKDTFELSKKSPILEERSIKRSII